MQRLLRLCLWQALIISISCFSLPSSAEESGIRIRGPKSSDAFPYDRYGPIVAKDTLWNIALKVRPDPSLSVYQVMQALYENNPNSFKDNNFNHMINGEYLSIPSIDVMRAINTANAQSKSRNDNKVWQKKAVKKVIAKTKKPEDMSVKKKDLDAAKSEINVQLKAIDSTQQEKLTNIQNDVLDSIDGLQSLLKENEILRQRLSTFNEQLGVMQNEVAKSKEIKMQMDDMIALQQKLLAKADAREQALLLEKQKAELEEQNFMSSTWFIVLMGTLPAIIIILFVAMMFRRRSNKEEAPKEVAVVEKQPSKPQADPVPATSKKEVDEDALDSELSLDDELSADLSETEEENDDLFSDDIDSLDDELLDDELLDDEVIQLDDELDALDDELLDDEVINLDDDTLDNELLDDEVIQLDDIDGFDDLEQGEPLEGGELDQSDLDSLLAGLDTGDDEDPDTEESIITSESSGETMDQVVDDLSTDISDPDDIDALLDAIGDEESDIEELVIIDESSGETMDEVVDDLSTDISDPDDIDALLDAIGDEESDIEEPVIIDESSDETMDQVVEEVVDDLSTDVSDPDDIDALLDAIGDEEFDIEEPMSEDAGFDEIVDKSSNEINDEIIDGPPDDLAEPDDIDALLDAIGDEEFDIEEPMSEDAGFDEVVDKSSDEINDEIIDGPPDDLAEPDDIDALLDAIGDEEFDIEEPMSEDAGFDEVVDKSSDEINDEIIDGPPDDLAEPDDIDALLDAIGDEEFDIEEPMSEDAGSDDTLDSANTKTSNDHSAKEITDFDEIDALLEELGVDGTDIGQAEDADKSLSIINAAKNTSDDIPDDIDALIDAIGIDDAHIEQHKDNTEALDDNTPKEITSADDIDALLEEMGVDGTDIGQQTDAEKGLSKHNASENISSDSDIPDDIDTLIDSIGIDEAHIEQHVGNAKATNEDTPKEIIDADDIDTLLEELGVDGTDISQENDTAEVSDFDEATLLQLLNDEDNADPTVEPSPDFTDSNVLAELLKEKEETNDIVDSDSRAIEAEDIKELDNVDFDDLLANIEEETSASSTDEFELNDELAIGDEFEESQLDDAIENDEKSDFVSVDSLLSDSMLADKPTESYKKMNIDVGLDEFPEFAGNANKEDLDDDNGMAAKLDLAKVYIEMGDNENAEVILLDVVNQGNNQQQLDAQKLLDSL